MKLLERRPREVRIEPPPSITHRDRTFIPIKAFRTKRQARQYLTQKVGRLRRGDANYYRIRYHSEIGYWVYVSGDLKSRYRNIRKRSKLGEGKHSLKIYQVLDDPKQRKALLRARIRAKYRR